MPDWRNEAAKWKSLSRKNEIHSKINLARVAILEAQLELARDPLKTPTLRADVAARVEKREREIRFWVNLMREIPGSPQQHAKHRS